MCKTTWGILSHNLNFYSFRVCVLNLSWDVKDGLGILILKCTIIIGIVKRSGKMRYHSVPLWDWARTKCAAAYYYKYYCFD